MGSMFALESTHLASRLRRCGVANGGETADWDIQQLRDSAADIAALSITVCIPGSAQPAMIESRLGWRLLDEGSSEPENAC